MKQLSALILFLNIFSGFSHAQVIGSDTVCAGYIYNYSVNVPGAVSYVWTVPSGWYDLTGQGTSQISVTCNMNGGGVCVECFDSNAVSMGTQCLPTYFGSNGSGNYHLEPSGNNELCDGTNSVYITPTLVYDGPGGGGCLPGCGNGTLHPNIVWGIYNGNFFQGLVGTFMSLSIWGNYTVAHVDTTYGSDFPQAIPINGCGGSVTGSFSFSEMNFLLWTWMSPSNVCVGDTFWLYGNGTSCAESFGGVFWGQFTNLIPLTTDSDAYQIQVVATGTLISYLYSTCVYIQGGTFDGSWCWYTSGFLKQTFPVPESIFTTDTATLCTNNCIQFLNLSTNASSYQWYFAGANPSSSTDSLPGPICYPNDGTFDVTLISSNPGCSDTLTLPEAIEVYQSPVADFSVSDSEFCTGSCIDFYNQSINGTAYLWNFNGASVDSSSDENPLMICYPDTGQYNVTLIAANGSCRDTLILPGYINVFPPPISDFISDTTSLCSDDCILFSNLSTNAFSYQWNFPGANPSTSTDSIPGSICYPAAGIFDVTLISSNAGCSDTLTIPNAIEVLQSPEADFTVSDEEICPGGCVDFYNLSADGILFLWSFNGAATDSSTDENPVSICYPDSGEYNVTLIAINGSCSDTLEIPQYITVYPTPPPISIHQSGDSLFASQGFFSYQWYQDGNLISGATQSYYYCTSNGDYNVIASDTNGCEVEAAINDVVTNLFSEQKTGERFFVYPNPAKDLLNIIFPASFSSMEKTKLKIMDTQNRLVYCQSLNSHTVDISQLTEGVYEIELVVENEAIRKSFLKIY